MPGRHRRGSGSAKVEIRGRMLFSRLATAKHSSTGFCRLSWSTHVRL